MSALPRRTGAASLATLTAFAAAFVMVNAVAPNWSHAAGLDFWEIDESVATLKRENARKQEILVVQDRLSEQIAVCESIVDAMIDGRLALPEAVDQLAEINRDRPGFAESLPCIHQNAHGYRECVEQYALAKLRARLENEPTRLAKVLKRLGAESRSASSHR